VILVTGLNGGVMVMSSFVITDVTMLVMGEVRSPYYHIDEVMLKKHAPNHTK
jgi:hypothetical protein